MWNELLPGVSTCSHKAEQPVASYTSSPVNRIWRTDCVPGAVLLLGGFEGCNGVNGDRPPTRQTPGEVLTPGTSQCDLIWIHS